MSDTPRTDALLAKWHGEWGADALLTLTRQLERELADEVRTARAMQCELDRINAARPEERAQEELTRLKRELGEERESHNMTIDHYAAREKLPGALWLAKWFHDTYEALAPEYGYETRPETRVFSSSTPNGKLLIAVCEKLRLSMNSGERNG